MPSALVSSHGHSFYAHSYFVSTIQIIIGLYAYVYRSTRDTEIKSQKSTHPTYTMALIPGGKAIIHEIMLLKAAWRLASHISTQHQS